MTHVQTEFELAYDMARCRNEACAVRQTCLRFRAKWAPRHQVFAVFPGGENCRGRMEMGGGEKENQDV